MNAFTIKDLENLTGIKAHTIRIWEQRYQFLKPSRTLTNIRYYGNSELKKILNIALLNKYGYKVSHIDRMSEAELKEKILSLNQQQAQQERLINELIGYMIEMEMDPFEVLIDNYIMARGIERTISQIIFPFLEKIGILWLTDHINPAQEHLVSNIIRQKLIVGIEGVSSNLISQKTVLLFLPEGEFHELGLLYLYFILKSRGIRVIYLGSNIPLKDVEYVARKKKPDYLFVHLTSTGGHFNFERYLTQAASTLKGFPVVISGYLAQNYQKETPEGIEIRRSFAEVMELVGSIH